MFTATPAVLELFSTGVATHNAFGTSSRDQLLIKDVLLLQILRRVRGTESVQGLQEGTEFQRPERRWVERHGKLRVIFETNNGRAENSRSINVKLAENETLFPFLPSIVANTLSRQSFLMRSFVG